MTTFLAFFVLICLGTLELPFDIVEIWSGSLKSALGVLEQPTEFWESLIARVRSGMKGRLDSFSFEEKMGMSLALKLLGPLLYGLGCWLMTGRQKERF